MPNHPPESVMPGQPPDVLPADEPGLADRSGTGRTVALALGSGGARGYAHIGVIQVLRERGYSPIAIAGSSMGALVGGLTAAGELDTFTQWALSLNQLDVVRLLDPSLAEAGAIRGDRLFGALNHLLSGRLIEDLPIPFTAVATDLYARREVWFQSGPLDEAIRASIAIPSVLTPVVTDERTLVDGGVLNPVPIEPTISVDAELTVAVSLSGMGPGGRGMPEQVTTRRRNPALRAAAAMQARRAARRAERTPSGVMRSMDHITRSLDAMGDVIARHRLASCPPDVLVTVPADACRTFDFYRAAELIALGRTLASDALDRAGIVGP